MDIHKLGLTAAFLIAMIDCDHTMLMRNLVSLPLLIYIISPQ